MCVYKCVDLCIGFGDWWGSQNGIKIIYAGDFTERINGVLIQK